MVAASLLAPLPYVTESRAGGECRHYRITGPLTASQKTTNSTMQCTPSVGSTVWCHGGKESVGWCHMLFDCLSRRNSLSPSCVACFKDVVVFWRHTCTAGTLPLPLKVESLKLEADFAVHLTTVIQYLMTMLQVNRASITSKHYFT